MEFYYIQDYSESISRVKILPPLAVSSQRAYSPQHKKAACEDTDGGVYCRDALHASFSYSVYIFFVLIKSSTFWVSSG